MYPFPVRIPKGSKITVVQPFHVRLPVDGSKALSVQTVDHIGVDIVCGTPEQTWGTECIWPFPWPGTVYDAQVDSPFGATQHAHSQIDGTDPVTGIQYSVIYIHLSSVTQTKLDTDTTVITYNQGDGIGRIGNNGAVTPKPTPARPLDGTHLHLGLGVKNPGELNYTMVDPLIYFDVTTPYYMDTQPFQFTRDLFFGSTNDDTLELQKRLGVDYGTAPGKFGPKTRAAVRTYQAVHNLPQTGIVGPLTRASLNRV